MTDASEAIRKIEEMVERWYNTGEQPEQTLLSIRRVVREADVEPVVEQQRHGAKVHQRRVLVVEDWVEVTAGDTPR